MPAQKMKTLIRTSRTLPALAVILTVSNLAPGNVQAADQLFAGDGSALTAAKWGPDGGPFTASFTTGNTANFKVVNGTGTGGTISVGGINVIENFTLTAASGTIGGTAATVNPIT